MAGSGWSFGGLIYGIGGRIGIMRFVGNNGISLIFGLGRNQLGAGSTVSTFMGSLNLAGDDVTADLAVVLLVGHS